VRVKLTAWHALLVMTDCAPLPTRIAAPVDGTHRKICGRRWLTEAVECAKCVRESPHSPRSIGCHTIIDEHEVEVLQHLQWSYRSSTLGLAGGMITPSSVYDRDTLSEQTASAASRSTQSTRFSHSSGSLFESFFSMAEFETDVNTMSMSGRTSPDSAVDVETDSSSGRNLLSREANDDTHVGLKFWQVAAHDRLCSGLRVSGVSGANTFVNAGGLVEWCCDQCHGPLRWLDGVVWCTQCECAVCWPMWYAQSEHFSLANFGGETSSRASKGHNWSLFLSACLADARSPALELHAKLLALATIWNPESYGEDPGSQSPLCAQRTGLCRESSPARPGYRAGGGIAGPWWAPTDPCFLSSFGTVLERDH